MQKNGEIWRNVNKGIDQIWLKFDNQVKKIKIMYNKNLIWYMYICYNNKKLCAADVKEGHILGKKTFFII